jgi:hypothetical protein
MGHSITAIILKGDFDKEKALSFDLFPTLLDFGLTLFHIDHYYSAFWQHKLKKNGQLDISNIDCIVFPNELVISEIVMNISKSENPEYAIILTEYFGGLGNQYANVFIGPKNADRTISKINQALIYLGVLAKNGQDEFDTIELDKIKSQPKYLEKYVELTENYGV